MLPKLDVVGSSPIARSVTPETAMNEKRPLLFRVGAVSCASSLFGGPGPTGGFVVIEERRIRLSWTSSETGQPPIPRDSSVAPDPRIRRTKVGAKLIVTSTNPVPSDQINASCAAPDVRPVATRDARNA